MTLFACGLVLAGLLLTVVAQLDRTEEPAPPPTPDVTELLAPTPLTPEDRRAGRRFDQTRFDLPAEGWIQISGPTGELAQQYRFDRLDPDPPSHGAGWLHMTRPELEVYLETGRVVTLRGASAFGYAPNQAVESGTLTGDVEIRLYEETAGARLDPDVDEPSLVVRTPEASFDNILGEVRCDGAIAMESPHGEFVGRQLKLLLNDQEDVIELLRLEQIDFIRLAAAPVSEPEPARDATPAVNATSARGSSPPPRAVTAASSGNDAAGVSNAPADARVASPPAAATDPETYYRLILHDDVEILQSAADGDRGARGDTLTIYFTMATEGMGMVAAGVTPVAPAFVPLPSVPFLAVSSALAASGASSPTALAPPPAVGDTRITCGGGMTMVPVSRREAALPSPRDGRVELSGAPVRIDDTALDATATCGQLHYHTLTGMIELIGDASFPLHLATAELDAEGSRLQLTASEGRGVFVDAGVMRFGNAASDADPETLSITWRDGVDLVFAPAGENGGLGALRQATFRGDVDARGRLLRESEDTTDALPPSTLHSDQVAVFLRPGATASDRAGLERLVADGAVAVVDADRRMWMDHLDVAFRGPGDDEEQDQVETLLARGNVQLGLADGRWVLADELTADAEGRHVTLTGSDVRLVHGVHVIDQTHRITIDETAERFVVDGRGRLRRFDRVVAGEAASGPLERTLFDHVPDAGEELRVTWTEGVEVASRAPAEGERRFRRANVRGNVTALSPEIKLTHADTLAIDFTDEPDAGSRIEQIEATGDVRLRSAGEPGRMRSDHLLVTLTESVDEATVPTRMVARGDVEIADDTQTMWANAVTVTFRPRPAETAADDRPDTPPADDTPDAFASARVAVETITAESEVQLALAGGERVIARMLVADQDKQQAALYGPDLVVLGEQYVLDRVDRLDLDRRTGRYRINGGGRFRNFATPTTVPGDAGPIPRPQRDEPPALIAEWTRSALYIEEADGRGSLTLGGNVQADSRPTDLELSTVRGDEVTLLFGPAAGDDDTAATQELARLQARGAAELESRRWRSIGATDAPRVFHIKGPEIDYDQRTLEGFVRGAGELLIRDEWSGADGDGGFATKGTTLLRWRDRLEMTRLVDEHFEVAMDGDVTCLSRGLDGSASTLTGQRLQAMVVRSRVEADGGGSGLDLGGSMELERLYGDGGIYVRTPERDVTCDVFDYNVGTGLAEVRATPGRMVSVLSADAGEPLRHERVLWNMRTDTITIFRGAGVGVP
ncbi:MAG: hypothetical protein HKO59_14265 [Phycisphaerales bacterium]|nr:hypothetical protein [Phycisphaerales bacterium]